MTSNNDKCQNNVSKKVAQEITALPLVAQQEVIDFIAFLKLRYGQFSIPKNDNLSTLESEPFIGMWQNRSDMNDSTTCVKKMRKKEWG